MTTTEVKLAQSAAARLRKTGWITRRYGGAEGPNCLVGAVRCEQNLQNAVMFAFSSYLRVLYVLAAVIREQYPDAYRQWHGSIGGDNESFIVWFNDTVLTTQDGAIALLEKAALRLEDEL